MPLDALTLDDAVEQVRAGLEAGRGGVVLTPNIEILRQYRGSVELQRILEHTELLVADGMPLVWASRIKGTPLPERITGTDILWGLTKAAASSGASVFLAGGRRGVASRAAECLVSVCPGVGAAAYPAYVEPGPLAGQLDDLARELVAAAPDIVYVGLPFAAQVHVATTLRDRLPGTWFVGVGSSFDFVTRDRPRAPQWVQRSGLEWAHRLVYEPHMWRRYLLHGLPVAAHLAIDAVTARLRGPRSR